MSIDGVAAALDHLEAHFPKYQSQLEDLVRIPSVSAVLPPSSHLMQSAVAVVDLMAQAGLESCRVIEHAGAHPYAYGEWLRAEGAPTLLLYGHHDVQPPGRVEQWDSPPFEPEERGGRLYGRGAVDDKAGVMMHIAACASWLHSAGRLPVNVKFIVEGEEEIGSSHLEEFLARHQAMLAADCIVLTDTANLDAGIGSLTVSLRGITGVLVEVQALHQPVHSGMWGGPVPDPVQALAKAIAELTTEDGQVMPALREGVRPLTDDERGALEALPFDARRFREQAGLGPRATLTGNSSTPVYGRMWREPAVSVIALDARPVEGSSNQIIDRARARISLRTVPDQDPHHLQDVLARHFEQRVPWGLQVNVQREWAGNWWVTDPSGPAFDAARRAMEAGYGRPAEMIGCGGSIPFVEPFARVLGGVPALLTGVEDPLCHAHSENESLLLDDWKRGSKAAVHLYAELARALID